MIHFRKTNVWWENRIYRHGGKIGFTEDTKSFCVDLHTTDKDEWGRQGGYFTCLPISPADYRKTHPTKAAYKRTKGGLTIFSDWGRPYEIRARKDIIAELVRECIEQGLKEQP